MTETAAYFIAATLEKAGVKRIYGVVGDSLNGFTDALRQRGKIEWVPVRHEEAAAAGTAGIASGIRGVHRKRLFASHNLPFLFETKPANHGR